MGLENQDFAGETEVEQGPSWARKGWPVDTTDDLTAALDPTQMQVAIKAAAAKAGTAILSDADIARAAGDSIRAMMLIRTYRVRGHLAANLDPLGLSARDLPADLTPEYHGFSGADLDRRIYTGGALGMEWSTIREIVQVLRRNYCGNVGLEYMHISDVEERRFLQDRMEGKDKEIQFTPEGKKAILSKVLQAEQYEKFLGRKYVGTKRFGLDGGESLNVLANVLAKGFRVIFHEFSGGTANPEDVGGSGDVKYHLGTSTDREFDGISVHMSLVPNPSHLETVDPVVLGKVRAQQLFRDDIGPGKHRQVLPVLIHGDAAFAAASTSSSTTRSASRPARNSGAARPIRAMSLRACRRRSSM
jgi:2-oxoglutarate dehydrogenase E1 component